MVKVLAENWWFLFIRGLLALAFAMVGFSARTLMGSLFLQPLALASVELFFTVFAVSAGLVTIAAALRGFAKDQWHFLLLDGLVITAIGILLLLVPVIVFSTLVRCLAAWAIALGAVELMAAFHLRRHIADEWLLAASGTGTLLFGVLLFIARPTSTQTLLDWLSGFALFSSAVMIALSLRLRAWFHHSQTIGIAFSKGAAS